MIEYNVVDVPRRDDMRRMTDNELQDRRRALQKQINQINDILFERMRGSGNTLGPVVYKNQTKKRGW